MNVWQTRVKELLNIRYPIIQGPMAGGITTPELVAAVSNAGGLGSLGAGYMEAEDIREAIRVIRTLTNAPFAVNLFVPASIHIDSAAIAQMNQLLAPVRADLGLSASPGSAMIPDFSMHYDRQVEVILEENVPVFSFTFGMPSTSILTQFRKRQVTTIGTATSVAEAVQLEEAGVDIIVAQGSEAGGHRGSFEGTSDLPLVGIMSLLPQVVDAVQAPVVAAGGIADGRGYMATRVLGGEGVQMGTRFIPAVESGAHPAYKEAVSASDETSTVFTKSFSGKLARGIENTFMKRFRDVAALPYPIQNQLTSDIRRAAKTANATDYMSMWAGQSSALASAGNAGQILADMVEQVNDIMESLCLHGSRSDPSL